MGDLAFAKQFLNTLDSKSTKYQPDHVFDPKTYQMRVPYTLAKLSHPPHPLPPRSSASAPPPPGSETAKPTITVVLKSPRNPTMTFTIPSVDPSTASIHALKESVQSHLGGPTVVNIEKVKLLLNKKPLPASKKTVAELFDDATKVPAELELGVMVMGGAPDPPAQVLSSPDEARAAVGPGSENAAAEAARREESTPMEGVERTKETDPARVGEGNVASTLEGKEFWDDLQGFLEQRIRNTDEAVKLRGLFERAWRSSASLP